MIYSKINLMCPTYGRARTKLPQFIQSFQAFARCPDNVVFTFCVNQDDTETLNYLTAYPRAIVIQENLPAPHLATYFNQMYDGTAGVGPDCLVSMVGDDMVARTEGWDVRVLDAVNRFGGWCGVFCDDGYLHADIPVNLFTTRQLVDATGVPFMCPLFGKEMIDTVWREVLQPLGLLIRIEDVLLEHKHSSRTDVGSDPTFTRLQGASNRWPMQEVSTHIYKAIHNLLAAMPDAPLSQSSSAA